MYILKFVLLLAIAAVFSHVRGETETLEDGIDAADPERRTLFTKRHALVVAAKEHTVSDSTTLLETNLNDGRMQVEGKGKKSKGGKKSKDGKKKSKNLPVIEVFPLKSASV